MSISLLLEMAATENPGRTAVVDPERRLSTQEVSDLADGGAGIVTESGAEHVVYVGVGGAALPVLIFASARAARPFTPLNYRLSGHGLDELLGRLPDPLIVVDERYRDVVSADGRRVMETSEFLRLARSAPPMVRSADPDDVAIVLFTSGTTSTPKAVELSHANITSYITGTVDFGSAGTEDAALICVPPYHVAGVNAAISNLYAGRRMVYLPTFDAAEWVRLINREKVTTATVVPTMLDRIIATLEGDGVGVPSLRNLAYGGAKVGLPLVRRALELMPDVGFVNAYGLTETSSTIAVLTPDDHRAAHGHPDPAVAQRLSSVGRPVPGIEIAIRDAAGATLGPGETGELFVRGDQVSGRYTGVGSVLDEHGWFATRDTAYVDDQGYLYICGRSDDTIIRGGENIAPAEIEDVLVEHPDVRQVAAVGIEDDQWGQAIVAVVVPEPGRTPDVQDLRSYVRDRLRGSRTPDRIVFRNELPANATGKVLRRQLVTELSGIGVEA